MTRIVCLNGFAAIGLAVVLAACQSPDGGQPELTPSGLPEVTLPARTVSEIKSAAGDFFRNRGYVESESASRHGHEMVFDKPLPDNKAGKALRVRLRLHKKTDGSWRLVGSPMGVESWRSDLEAERMLPQGANQVQGFLLEIKRRLETGS